jgi:hypothetical protein
MLGGAKGQHAVTKHAGGHSVEGRHVGHFMLGRLGGCMMDMLHVVWRHAGRRHAWRWLSKRHVYCRRYVE